ncbi:MAG: zinc ribbon domain-containing protein, partial [Prevotella sp.]
MAMIKCPECGRQISDKAPVCPNCGVEIAGKITLCPQCGEAYFSDQESCPNCHHLTHNADSVNKTVSNQEPERQNVSPRSTP